MKECLIDYLLSDLDLSLEDTVDIIDFYMVDVPKEEMDEIKEDLKHAFLSYSPGA